MLNFIITETTKIENIIFQIKNQEQKVQLKAMILKKNEGYFFYLIDYNNIVDFLSHSENIELKDQINLINFTYNQAL